MRPSRLALALLATAVLAPGVLAHDGPHPAPAGKLDPAAPTASKSQAAPRQTAVATLQALGGSGVSGTVTFTDVGSGVQVVAEVAGLTPGDHGFHVHEKGDCSAPDGTSAGPHFNPGGAPHGGPRTAESHHGDFGNLTAGADGRAKLTFVSNRLKLAEGADGVLGRSVIVHADPDDMKTQPTGNSGARIACGVIALQPAAAKGPQGKLP